MNHIQNEMRRQAMGVMGDLDHVRTGIVRNYDPNTYSCKVEIQPEGNLSNWLPIHSLWVGNGWGLFCPPGPGSCVRVVPVEGKLDAAYVLPGFFDDEHQPLAVGQGEFWLVHASGASFKLTNDGKAKFSDGHGASVALNGDGTISSAGTWTHTGNFSATGNVADGTRSMAGDRAIFNAHTQPISGGVAQAPTIHE